MKRTLLILAMVVSAMMLSCNPKDDDDNDNGGESNNPEIRKPTVVTISVEEISETTAKVVGQVTDNGGAEVTERGICWNTEGAPTIIDWRTSEGEGLGRYNSYLTDLEPNTTYYVRAYATNAKGTTYGEEKSFTTLEPENMINGHEYVDLGLPSGLKWATCNVGASSPEDYGDYFAWGETNPKAEYTEENSVTHGEQMGDISGNAQYDAATANWGGGWRMPSKAEMRELVDHCEWEWTQLNGVNGARVIGPNGSCIFLPAAGYRYGTSLNNDGFTGDYWSSTPDDGYDDYAYSLLFCNGYENVLYYLRSYGQTVRPITE